jgi:hypothetical protein
VILPQPADKTVLDVIISDGAPAKLIQIMGAIVHSGKMPGAHIMWYFFHPDNPPAKM